MDAAQIEKLKALALAATQGARRWWACRDGDHDYVQIAAGPERIAQVRIRSLTEADLNLFIATDPAAMLELIAEAERLRAEKEDQRASLERAAEYLEHYAKYLYEVKLEDIERHPYIPSIEEAASELRAMIGGDGIETNCRGRAQGGNTSETRGAGLASKRAETRMDTSSCAGAGSAPEPT